MFQLIFIERQMKVCTLVTFSSRVTKLIWFESFPTYISALSLRNLCAEVSLKRLISLKQSFDFDFQDLVSVLTPTLHYTTLCMNTKG